MKRYRYFHFATKLRLQAHPVASLADVAIHSNSYERLQQLVIPP